MELASLLDDLSMALIHLLGALERLDLRLGAVEAERAYVRRRGVR